MPCIVDPPSVTTEDWLEHMLCQACQFLTKEQIEKIKGLDFYIDLDMWYQQHLMDDVRHYSRQIESMHTKQLGMFYSEEEKKDHAEKQVQRCIDESKRMGYELIIKEGSIESKTIK